MSWSIEEFSKHYNLNDFKFLCTGMKGDLADRIFNSVMGQLSDGMWENTPSMQSYWQNCHIVSKNDIIYLAINNGLYWNRFTKKYTENIYRRMTDEEILRFWLKRMKLVYTREKQYYDKFNTGLMKWSAKNDYQLRYYDNVTIAELYKFHNEFSSYIDKMKATQILMGKLN